MRHYHFKSITACLLLAAAGSANADIFNGTVADYQRTRAEGRLTHLLEIDNDSLLLNKNDGFYTSGLRYTQMHSLRIGSNITSFGWRIGQELYTASDIKLPPSRIAPNDHPYAGWLYGGFFKHEERADGSYVTAGVDIGCLGPCAGGEWTQTNLHRLLNQPLPRGWGSQVKSEPGVVMYVDIAPLRWAPTASFDITPHVDGRFGNIYTDVGAGVMLRAGRLPIWPTRSTLHGFMRADVHAVGYNATLQGGWFSRDDPHTVDPRRMVGEAEAGVVWNDGAYGARVGIVRRSNEISDLPNAAGAQNFVRLQFSYVP